MGATGATGATGSTGAAGMDGATGATGPAGPAPSGTGFVKVTGGVLDTPSATTAETTISFTDITTGDVSTTKHGFTPKAPNDTTKFLRGDASWAALSGAPPDGAPLTSAKVWVGNGSNVAAAVSVTGDVTISNAGVTAIGSGKVTEAMQVLADNTTGDVSTTKHGYAPKAPNSVIKFLDGTGAWAPASRAPALMFPQGIFAANASAVTAFASGTTYALYLGKYNGTTSGDAFYAQYSLRLTTLVATSIVWAEIAIAKGDPVISGPAQLTTLCYLDVSSTFASGTGIKSGSWTSGTAPAAGDDLWILMGSQAGTPYQVRGGVADDIVSGTFLLAGSTRPSTMSANTSFTAAANNRVPAWVCVEQPH